MEQIGKMSAARKAKLEKAGKIIPHGPYCYAYTGRMIQVSHMRVDGSLVEVAPYSIAEVKPCPFYKIRGDWPEQQNGYCRLLKAGDRMKHRAARTDLLWDSCKACGINEDEE